MHSTCPHVYPPKMWCTIVVSCVLASSSFSAFSPANSFSAWTCMPSSKPRMYSCESSCLPRTKCFAMLPMALVSLPMEKDPRGSESSALSTCFWYSHVTQKPGFLQLSCGWGSSAKCAVSRRVW